MKKLIIILFFILLSFHCTWTPKTVLPKHYRIIHIPKFENETIDQPQLTEVITQKVIEKFELDGRLTVTEYVANANAILFGNIVKYDKIPLSYTDIGELDVNVLTIQIDIKLRDIKTGKLVHDMYVKETIEFNFKSEPVETEVEAQERIIEILSDKIVSKVIEGW